MRTRKSLALIVLFLLSSLTTAHDQELPWLWGNLDWSSDGQYLAVATFDGIHIHRSDDLSLYKVLKDFKTPTFKWSNDGLRLAVETREPKRVAIWNLETEEETYLWVSSGKSSLHITNIQWSPWGTLLAGASEVGVDIWDTETQMLMSQIRYEGLYIGGWPRIHWRPGDTTHSFDILTDSIVNGIVIWNQYTGWLVDFIWNSGNSPARWSPDGNMIAAGDNPVTVWKVKPDNQTQAVGEIGGEKIHRFEYKRGRFEGLSWHPDSTKLAFVFLHGESGYPPEQDFSRDGALIWDLSTGATKLLPGVFIIDMYKTYQAIEWSPDGSRLASVSGDGRVVIWETSNYEIVAEYAGYRSLLDP